MSAKYVVVSPVRDEAEFLQRTIDSVVAQTVRPAQWIIVDDGSTDQTRVIAERAAAEHPWIKVIHRADRGDRLVGPGVIDAFYDGYSQLNGLEYHYLCKLDGDITFGKTYFEYLIGLFDRHPDLGSASGKVYLPVGGKLIEERMIDEHVAGQVKFYRRECFEQIGGLVRGVMWDVIDEHRARMAGWRTGSFRDDELAIVHHRLMGSSHRSIVHGRLRWGRGQYFMGSHPLYVLASGINRVFDRPLAIGGASIMLGYCLAWLKRSPRYEDPEFRKDLRRWQLGRLHLACSRERKELS